MKIGVVGDVHWSKYSSIIRSRKDKYSTRLQNCILSINWAEKTMSREQCDLIVYLGDFFDKCDLNAEEITALSELHFAEIPHVFLVGNHEMGLNDLMFSSAHLFDLKDMTIINEPTCTKLQDVDLCFLPYILEDAREPIYKYIPICNQPIVFSHNDIKGIQMGNIISKAGFDIEDIEQNCKLFLNGHIHNGSKVSDKIINVGNLTGQNFSEDATEYSHSIYVLNTDNMECSVFDNPHAFNFFKCDVVDNYYNIKPYLESMPNPVLTIKLKESQVKEYEWVKDYCVASRFIIQPEITRNSTEQVESLSVNHLDKFKEYIISELGNSEDIVEELEQVVG